MNTENHYSETDLGNISIHLCGEYDPQRAYEYLDAVEFGGGSYICAIEYGKTITGIAPEPTKNTEYWHINSIPGTLTPEYIAMHDRVVNLSEQVEADAEEVRTAEQNVSGMELNVTQMQEQTRQSAEAAEQSKDSAAGYASSADASRQAAEESEQNINAQVTGFDAHVAEKTSEAESDIEAARIAANKAILAQQEQSVNEVARVGGAAVSAAQAAAQTATEKASAAAESEKNAKASETAAKLSETNATKMAEQVATDKEQVAYDRTAVENAKQEMAGSVAQIEQNTQGISELKGDLEKQKNFFDEIICKNLFNPDDKEAGHYIINQTTGAISANDARFTTGYIPLKSGESVIFTYDFTSSAGTTKRAKRTCYSLACYNLNKELLSDTVTSSVSEYTANSEDIVYIRVCFYADNLNTNLMIEYGTSITDYEPYKIEYRLKEENRNLSFDELSEKVNKNETDISKLLNNNVRAYLPDVIYCAVGRTIEIYNQYVCLNDKYHINWVCDIGKALKRKFSITGTEALIGDYQLTLNICDDELNVVWSKTATLKIVSDVLSESHNINPIGDSLSNNKLWLGECERLSNGKIQYVGTNAFSQSIEGGTYTGGHEGYSGVAGNFFLSQTNGFSTNPYYTDSANVFDVSGYCNRNSISIDAIQIMLGTNGINNFNARITEIRSMINHIRAWNTTIPIFVVAPIYRGNQNGIGVQINNEGYSVQKGRYEYEYRTYSFEMIEKEDEMVKSLNDSNIHFIPLGLFHDGEYNFGNVATPVNPRCEVTESMPTESVHPQPCGQLQMADEMYSTYCGIFG